MRVPWPVMSASCSGSRRNRRGGVVEVGIGLFMMGILLRHGVLAFGPESKMSRRGLTQMPSPPSGSPAADLGRRPTHGGGGAVTARWRPGRPSDAELLVHEPRHLAAVGAALGLAHHVADDRPDRLGVAGANLLGGVRVRCQGGGDHGAKLIAAVERL